MHVQQCAGKRGILSDDSLKSLSAAGCMGWVIRPESFLHVICVCGGLQDLLVWPSDEALCGR